MKFGNKINMRFLDSVNFLPMPLSKLPKSFGLSELKKGYFPHLFNTPDNENEVLDHLPDAEFYSPDTMSTQQRKEFYDWYEIHKNDKFDFQKELVSYCVSDVDILRRACCEFRTLVRKATGTKTTKVNPEDLSQTVEWSGSLDPFSCMTIASVCLKVFTSKFLPENWMVLLKENEKYECSHEETCECEWTEARKLSGGGQLFVKTEETWIPEKRLELSKKKFHSSPIAVLPNCNILGKDVYSQVALEWLAVKEKELGTPIRTALSTLGEKQVAVKNKGKVVKLKLDGYMVKDGVEYGFEFYGCSFHGCTNCYQVGRHSTKILDRSLAQRYRDTLQRESLLREKGIHLTTVWSCEFEQQKKDNPDLMTDIDIEPCITLNDCYFGGRTNALVLHKKFEGEERGYYLDFTSLYPAVLKYNRFPIGHPERYVKDFENTRFVSKCTEQCQCLNKHQKLPYFGLIKVTLLPPQNLIIPVLPVRINGKLKFPLCYTCALNESKGECHCSKEKRMITQTYCTPEVEVALNMGYELIKIHQVLHWKDSEVHNVETKEGGLFTSYINTFLQLKQQASGYPENVTTEKQKKEYIDSYFDHEGVQLNPDEIEKNPGLRSLSKLALNSFYGKFGQRMNLKQSTFINDIADLYQLLTDPSKVVTNWHIMSEDVLLMDFQRKDNFDLDTFVGNVVIAAFCTCWARLKLWGTMNKLGSRVLYHDTDSIIFSAKPGEYFPPTGSYLGDFTSELTCKELSCDGSCSEGHWISEFVSCGPKNYAYQLNTGETFCKVRGFSLNHQNSQVLNFQSMKRALFAWHKNEPEEFVTVSTMILRDKQKPKIFNKQISKKYGVVYDKRQVMPDMTTLPYGFRL
jgi:hypothetical protein